MIDILINKDEIFVVDNFISKEDAKIIISEINNPSEIKEYPAWYAERNGGTALPYNDRVLDILKRYGNKSNRVISELFSIDKVYTTKGYSSKWLPGTSGGPHIDNIEKEKFIEWSTVIYLNEPPEFSGGEIYFPNKNFSYTPKFGTAVFFPQYNNHDYIHGISEVTSGERYTLLFHHSSNIDFADPDILELN